MRFIGQRAKQQKTGYLERKMPDGRKAIAAGLILVFRPRIIEEEENLSCWVIIFGLALFLFGADKLPKLGRSIGHTIKEFREGQKEIAPTEEPRAKQATRRTRRKNQKGGEKWRI